MFLKKIKFLFYFFMFSDHFDVLILKINFKSKKNIILIYFQTKNTLKNNRYLNIKLAWRGITD